MKDNSSFLTEVMNLKVIRLPITIYHEEINGSQNNFLIETFDKNELSYETVTLITNVSIRKLILGVQWSGICSD